MYSFKIALWETVDLGKKLVPQNLFDGLILILFYPRVIGS